MSVDSDGVNVVVSMSSGVESNEGGASDGIGRVRDSGCKISVEGKGISSDVARALDQPKVLDTKSNDECVNPGVGGRRGSAGPSEVRSNRDDMGLLDPMFPGGPSIMEFVGRVLRRDYSCNEVNDGNTPIKEMKTNLFADCDAWQGGVTSGNGMAVEGGMVSDNDSDRVSSCSRGSDLDGNMVTNKLIPDGKPGIGEETNNAEAVVLIPKGCAESVIKEPMSANAIIVGGTVTDNDSDKVGSGCLETGLKGNGVTIKATPDQKSEIEEANKTETGVLVLKSCKESVTAEATSVNRIAFKGAITNNDSDKVSSGCRGADLDGDLVTNKSMPDGKSETLEANNAEADALILKGRGLDFTTKKEGEYYVSALVWGKVRSHPWWPGQIFAPEAASGKALKHFKRDKYLVAYFGDQSFAWNDESKIKPFQMYFREMEKQSNVEGFSHAVSCALDEVSRRVEVGLSCPCVSQEVRNKINNQVFLNAGVRNESSKGEACDNLYSAVSFFPGELVGLLGAFAKGPQTKPDRFEFAITKARLLAFNRWKGRYQLPVFEQHGELLEDNAEFTAEGEASYSLELLNGRLPGDNDVPSKKRKWTTGDGSSRKQNQLSTEERCPQRKEKCMSVLKSSSLQIDNEKALERTVKKNISSGGKRKYMSSAPSNMKVKRQKNLFSPIPTEIPSPDEILSTLSLVAGNPMQGHDILIPVIGLLCEFRNSICQENSYVNNPTRDAGKEKENHRTNMESTDTFGCEGTEDSYWTDRIIQSYSQDQDLFEPGAPSETTAKLEPEIGGNVNLGNNNESNTVISSEEYCRTALILNFTNLESIPSVSNLNEIFSRYGPLNESETEILKKSKSAKVIFKKRADAEVAYSSSGKYSIFGPSLTRYSLNYAPTPCKARATPKRNKSNQP